MNTDLATNLTSLIDGVARQVKILFTKNGNSVSLMILPFDC